MNAEDSIKKPEADLHLYGHEVTMRNLIGKVEYLEKARMTLSEELKKANSKYLQLYGSNHATKTALKLLISTLDLHSDLSIPTPILADSLVLGPVWVDPEEL